MKQPSGSFTERCCWNAGTLEVYQAFQAEIQRRQLENRVEVRRSGCLDHCEAGAVALVYQPRPNEFTWLPTKLRLKLQRFFTPQRRLYGHLTCADVLAIVESQFVQGRALKRCQIFPHL